MQTFLPYPDFAESFRVLDDKRLGNQIYREGIILLRGGWKNHPCAKMWSSYKWALCQYLLAGLEELNRRHRYYPYWNEALFYYLTEHSWNRELPPWLGNEDLHSSHRAALLYKNYQHYSQFGWLEQPAIPNPQTGSLSYIWGGV